jgi:hypothetical protein
VPDQAGIEKMLAANENMVNDTFMETLNGLVAQVDNQAGQGNAEAKALGQKMELVYKTALKFSMKKKIS